ncbi:HSP70-domain-containing protein [Coccomyxa subellipsoidea C-169]|uniref:HSP70-domain-containing protein n=1 Tax=Coccomyxa subellipsoidea (strain C-169) TaxID=574566 RepID=I0YSY5_COCSC|nr:HSP70-domain-containing protein [Coccomyxa subellipsoidea C-169]EIE21504.1 HSP70-domain-containing protein [Coccomyxa subellipsoidea C-169]|eukprot:XP_005646048.1 HSP70-domain-containing protein [Coccomyxa subellipsoidea C-169]
MERRIQAAPGRRRRDWVALVLCILQITAVCAGPLMAVDFGGEFIKVSVVKPGRTPISIVPNEMSKRRTSAQVAFVDGDRLLGEEAAALSVRYPDRVYARTRDLVGKLAASEAIGSLLADNHLPYTIVEDEQRKTVSLKTHTGELLSAEALVASILHYAQRITSAASEGAPVVDCVIVVPPFFGPAQRQGLIDAAQLAGLNVLALINSHAAAALQYGIERDFTNKTEWVVLYDMGATSTEAALVKFSSFTVKEFGKPKTHSQFEVKDVAWDEALGAEKLDLLLLDHFADEFQAKHGVDIRQFPKAVAKLKRQVKRTKEILSANSEAPISVEELHNGIDFRSRITREQFEGLAGDFFTRAAAPLEALMERSGLAVGDLQAVELLGGGSRVPAVQTALSRALGGRALDKHLDADEAVVLGAGLFAANLSTTFRLRKFGMADGATYPIQYQETEYKPKSLLPFMKRIPARRMVHLPEQAVDPLSFTLSYNSSYPLPSGIPSPVLAQYDVTGIKDVSAKHSEPAKLNLHVHADASGLIHIDKAEAVLDVMEEYTVKVPHIYLPSRLMTASLLITPSMSSHFSMEVGAGKGSAAAANETVAEKIEFEEVTKTRKKTLRLPLKLSGPGLSMPKMTPEQIKEGKRLMAQLAAKDGEKRDAAAAKNDLESYIIATGSTLDEPSIEQVTTEKQREAFRKALMEVEDWLYTDGEAEKAPVFRKKLGDLRASGDPMAFRAAEAEARPGAVAAAQGMLDMWRKAANLWRSQRPWMNATDIQALLDAADAYESWLNKDLKRQKKLKAHEDPVLKSADVDAKLDDVRKIFTKLKNKKQPKPPRPAAPANDTAAADDKIKSDPDQSQPAEEQVDQEVEVDSHEDVRLEEGAEGEKASKDEL